MFFLRLCMAVFFLFLGAQAQAIEPLTDSSTVSDFSLQCQHPAMKSDADRRSKLCIGYITEAKNKIGEAKKTPSCWDALGNKASPMAIADMMFAFAMDPKDKRTKFKTSLSEIVLIAAPECL